MRNLYIYFWRWATWKVFGDGADRFADERHARKGIVCFITVAGFLNGPGFEKMRADLRRDADAIWIIDCSPEGHQPEVATRVFQGVQHPVCIVLAVRTAACTADTPAKVRFRSLPSGPREAKFNAIADVTLDDGGWVDCPDGWRMPFLPAAQGAWADFPALTDLFVYNGSGVMPGRTWVIAPDAQSLRDRWKRLIAQTDPEEKERLFHPHQDGDKTSTKTPRDYLPGAERRGLSVAKDNGPVVEPVRYGFRSFDRQWIIPDSRLINRPNPTLWRIHSSRQIVLTALIQHSPTGGPAATITSLIPDLHHYKGSFGGRAFPLWTDAEATTPNLSPALLAFLSTRFGRPVCGETLFAYVAAIAANPAYTARFQAELIQPGLRIPLTDAAETFFAAADLGREIVWLHTFGERFADPVHGRPASPPRLPADRAPRIPRNGAIPADADTIDFDPATGRLLVGTGCIERVTPAMWKYEVSGKRVLTQWFSYRRRNRERPLIGDRRPPSPLCDIRPDAWQAEYTTELLNVLNVLGRLIDREPHQADMLERVVAGALITDSELRSAGAFAVPEDFAVRTARSTRDDAQPDLFSS